MFERLHDLADGIAGQATQQSIESVQNELLEAQRSQLFNETLASVRGENLALLDNLAEIGNQLYVAGVASKLSEALGRMPKFSGIQAQLEPFAWMPHAEALVGENLSVAEGGVRAIRGWHIGWQSDQGVSPGATILLYQRKPDSPEEKAEVPRLAVVPERMSELMSVDKTARIDCLLRAESAMSYRYQELLDKAQHYKYDELTNKQRAQFIAEARAVNWGAIRGFWSIPDAEQLYEKSVFRTLTDPDSLEWTQKEDSERHSPLILAQTYSFEVYCLQSSKNQDEIAQGRFIHPDILSKHERIYESRELASINGLFAPPSIQKSWFGFWSKEVSGGAIAEKSWPVELALPANMQLERQKIAERLEALYSEEWAA